MEDFGYWKLVAFAAWALFGIVFVYDQMRLLKTYKKDVDSNFELEPINENQMFRNPIPIIWERLRIVHARYPKHQRVDRLAKRVRREMVVFFILFIIFAVAP
jgi:hypothetical protein